MYFKTNHVTSNCFVLKRVKNYLKEHPDNNTINFLAHALRDPYDDHIVPLREDMAQIIDWEDCNIAEEEIEEIITAALQLPETYEYLEREETDDSY